MRYDWILFDADGTLFDYDQAEACALEQAFQQAGLAYRAGCAEAYRRINARIWQEFEQGKITQALLRTRRFDLLFAELGIQADAAAFSARYLKNLAAGTQLIRGAEALLRSLHGRVGLALVTNGLAEVQRPRLAASTLAGYFTSVVISEEVGSAKPDPRIFEIALAQMGSPSRKRVLVVGDSLSSDILGGNRAGFDTCWYNPVAAPPRADIPARFEIRRLEEVQAILAAGS